MNFSRFRVTSIAIYITERIYLLLYIGFFAAHKRNPRIGKFQVPLGPLIPVLSILFNVCLLLCFSVLSLLCFVIWILIGKLMYYILFIYMHEDKRANLKSQLLSNPISFQFVFRINLFTVRHPQVTIFQSHKFRLEWILRFRKWRETQDEERQKEFNIAG